MNPLQNCAGSKSQPYYCYPPLQTIAKHVLATLNAGKACFCVRTSRLDAWKNVMN